MDVATIKQYNMVYSFVEGTPRTVVHWSPAADSRIDEWPINELPQHIYDGLVSSLAADTELVAQLTAEIAPVPTPPA